MRKYLIDSTEAKARIVAIALLADGSLDKSELDLLDRNAILERLGMSDDDFDRVVHDFCDDMLQYAGRNDCGELEIGREAIDLMLDEIGSRDLRKLLLRTIFEIVYADRRLSAGEAVLASQAMCRWHIDLQEIGYAHGRSSRRWPPYVLGAVAAARVARSGSTV
jgi:uncharacterized tellurite resistance protein B-like protein